MLAALATTLLLPLLAVALPQSAAPSGPSIQSTVTSASGKNNYYNGCFDELKAGLKALNHPVEVAAASFTPQSCVSACEAAGYSISGLMNGNTCFCDNAISAKAPKLKDSECNNTCAGDSGLFCGGTFHLQVYYTKRSGLPKPTAPQRVGEDPQEYEYLGCWSSTHEERALQGHYIGADNITPASCASQCYALGFKFAGTHFGRECFCGQTLIKSKPETPSDCSYACAGDSTQLCGSDNHINLYVAQDPPDVLGPKFHAGGLLTAYFSVGCYVDPVNPRLLGTLLGSGNDMTADKCANLASRQRLAYFGVENGNECFGADRLPATADQVDPSSCNTACRGNDNYSCGGGGRLDLYKSPLWSIF